MNDINSMLTQDEGQKLKPYLDCCGLYWRECTCPQKGKLTVGIGRNLDDVGISADEAAILRNNDKLKAIAASSTFPWFQGLDSVRKDVITMMVFNMGLGDFCKFKRMIAALEKSDYGTAATEMLNSQWSAQVGKRAARLAAMMQSGQYP